MRQRKTRKIWKIFHFPRLKTQIDITIKKTLFNFQKVRSKEPFLKKAKK